MEYSFLCARNTLEKLGADIKLFYNDYNMFMSGKRQAALALIQSVQHYAQDEKGQDRKLMDGIGMQGYLGGYGTQNGCLDPGILRDLETSIRQYSAQGLEVQLTEMAVRNFDASKVREHDEYYGKLFSDVFMKANTEEQNPLTAVCIWGLVDAPLSAKGNYTYNLNSPYGCLLNTKYQIKTCFDRVYHVLKGE